MSIRIKEGTTSHVEIDDNKDTVSIRPKLKSAKEVAESLHKFRTIFLQASNPHIDEKQAETLTPARILSKKGDSLNQKKTEFTPIDDIEDEKLRELPDKTKIDFIRFLTFYLVTVKVARKFTPDIFGENEKFTGLRKKIRGLNARNSTNIGINENQEACFLDLDWYYREERSSLMKFMVWFYTDLIPIMPICTRILKKNLHLSLNNNEALPIEDIITLATTSDEVISPMLRVKKLEKEEDLLKLFELIHLNGHIHFILHLYDEIQRIATEARKNKAQFMKKREKAKNREDIQALEKEIEEATHSTKAEIDKTILVMLETLEIANKCIPTIIEWQEAEKRLLENFPKLKKPIKETRKNIWKLILRKTDIAKTALELVEATMDNLFLSCQLHEDKQKYPLDLNAL